MIVGVEFGGNFFKKSIGSYVQMEGFLSTSLEESSARAFIKNAFLEITVANEQLRPDDYGFADIA